MHRVNRVAFRAAFMACISPQLFLFAAGARAQDAGALPLPGSDPSVVAQAPVPPRDRSSAEKDLRELQAMKRDMQNRMGDFDARIRAIESQLGVVPSSPAMTNDAQVTPTWNHGQPTTVTATAEPAKKGFAGFMQRREQSGTYDAKSGFVLVDDDDGRLNFGFTTYARYLNQNSLDASYTDSFGRVIQLDRRNELQLNKVSLNFKGWLLDPKFQYLLFAWTNNSNQGEGAQVVLAGFLRYKFANWLGVSAGIMPLPTTRSTNYSFPNWLRHDNRVMADEFYRGSYTSGVDAFGEISKGLRYRVMIGNNLSTLGVSSKELDNKFDTLSAALWWMPTTGEFGQGEGFGDYDYHEKVATYLGAHASRSTETAQGQPSENDFENSQIRLTDGTLLFSPDPFLTGGVVEKARWRMINIDAGIKYKGMSLEAQYYWRKVDEFKTIGIVPINQLKDHGIAVQASAMPIKDLLQVYMTGSKIWGANGDPTEFSAGVNVYPFKRREMHVNLQAIKTNLSPVGGFHMPILVGSNGWVFLTDWIVMF